MSDPNRGHVQVRDIDGTLVATILDMGGHCAIHSDVGTYTPHQATLVAGALAKWAARKRLARAGGAP